MHWKRIKQKYGFGFVSQLKCEGNKLKGWKHLTLSNLQNILQLIHKAWSVEWLKSSTAIQEVAVIQELDQMRSEWVFSEFITQEKLWQCWWKYIEMKRKHFTFIFKSLTWHFYFALTFCTATLILYFVWAHKHKQAHAHWSINWQKTLKCTHEQPNQLLETHIRWEIVHRLNAYSLTLEIASLVIHFMLELICIENSQLKH